MKTKINPYFLIHLAPIIFFITVAQSATADDGTWSGAPSSTWDTTDANWTGVTGTPWDSFNGTNNAAIFNTASLAAVVSGPVFTNGITFSTSGALSNSTIILSGGSPTITVAAGQTGTISSIIAGSAGLLKSGAGLLTLSDATCTGGTTVIEGRLELQNTMTGSPNYTTDAQLEFNLTTGDKQAINGTFSGSGRLIKTGGSNLILSDWSGNQTVELTGEDSVIDIQAGTLSNFFAASLYGPVVTWIDNQAGLTIASGATFDLQSNNITVDELNGSGTFTKDSWNNGNNIVNIGVNNGSGTFSGVISNPKASFAIVKQGTGIQTLSGNNIDYKGGTTVDNGRLVLQNTKTGNPSFTTNAELEFKFTTGDQQFQDGTFSGTGKLIKTGGNEMILSNWGGAQTVALTGSNSIIDVQAGTLSNFGAAAFGAPPTVWTNNKAGLTVASGATFQINNNGAIVDELSGAGTINKGTWDTAVTLTIGVNDGSGTFSGAITQTVGQTMGLLKNGMGTQTLTGANTYNGSTTISAGTLALVGGSQASPITVSPGASLGFTLGSPTTSTSSFDLTTGTVRITGTPTLASYTLITSSSGISGTPTLNTAIPGYTLVVDGNSLKLAQVGGSGYSTWATTNAPTGTSAADYDGDGVTNGVEYVVGGTKDTNDLSKLPQVSTSGANMVVTFNRDQASINATTTLVIEVGTTLVTWPASYNVPGTAVTNNPGVTVTKDTSVGFDTITLTVPRAPDNNKFARLNVTTN